MAIKSKDERPERKLEIDLDGPEGNAYALMAYANKFAVKLNMDADAIQKDMQSGDYEHLLKVFEKHFGDYVILYR